MKPATTLYLASATEQLLLVEDFVDRLRARGFAISYEWTKDVREGGFKADVDLTPTQRRYAARMDSHGVKTADLVWVLTPSLKNQGCGMWIEMGMALALGKRVIISGALARRSVFAELAEGCFDDHAAAFEYILQQAIAA